MPFFLLTHSLRALGVILLTHALIDRYRLAVYLIRAKNGVWEGDRYPGGTSEFLRLWLVIIADNTLHVVINYLVLRYL